MRLKNYILPRINFIVALGTFFMLASCGSYQYVGYDNDGIYDTPQDQNVFVQQNEPAEEISTEPNSSSYYKNYFNEKSAEVDSQGEIFTDIDSYTGTVLQDDYVEQPQTGYGGWGQNSSEVAVNFYNNGPLWGGGFGWGAGFGWGGRFGWNRPFWGSPYWGNGFYGGGFGFYDPFYCPFGNFGYGGYGFAWRNPYRFYGNPYRNPYYRGYAGNRFYGNSVTYNSGRRSSAAQLGRRGTTETGRTRNSLYRNPRSRVSSDGTIIRRPRTEINRNGVGVSPNRRSNNVGRSNRSSTRTVTPRTTRPRVNSTPRRSPNNRTVTPRRSSNNRTMSTPRRSSNNNIRSSSPRRSSGNISRSSGRSSSSFRSSSSVRSSGSRSSGRRNN